MNQHDLAAAVLVQERDQSIVETADFEHGHEPLIARLPADVVEKGPRLVGPGTDLPLEDHGPLVIANGDGQLLVMLVDSEVYSPVS